MKLSSINYLQKTNNQQFKKPNFNNVVHINPKDSVSFSGVSSLIAKYGIKLSELKIMKTENVGDISPKTIEKLVAKIIEANEHAKKNIANGNVVKSACASNVGLSDGSWAVGTNFNNTVNATSAICGERSAIVVAYNNFLKKLSIDNVDKNAQKPQFMVDYVAMSSNKELGSDRFSAAPCADCLSWFNTNRFFKDDTIIATLFKDEKGKFELALRTLKDYLPLRKEIPTPLANQKISDLNLEITKSAQNAMQNRKINEKRIITLFKEAKKGYDANMLTPPTSQKISATIYNNKFEIINGQKIDWSDRWFMEPGELAIAKALEIDPKAKIKALAYYGDGIAYDKFGEPYNDGVVSIQTLGRMLSKFGDDEILIITKVGDDLKIRTIEDYIPRQYRYIQSYLRKP